MMNIEKDLNVARAAKLDTPTLSDALDRLSIVGQCYKIKPKAQSFRMTGRAWTVKYGPASNPPGTVGDFIDDVPAGSVIVLDNNGRDDVTVWGDILTEAAHTKGITGTVINGINRDTHLCLSLEYPVFSLDSWMRTGKDRVQVEAMGIPVNVGGARVQQGDIMRGDTDGVVVIPKEHEERVLQVAEEIEAAENHIREAVRSGMRLDEARKINNYHHLQTREQVK